MNQQSHSQAYNPEEAKTEKDICTPILIAALSMIARICKQPKCPLTDEWINKQWYAYTMEYYSAIKRNTLESVLMRQKNIEPIILKYISLQTEVYQKEKDKYCILRHIYRIYKDGTKEFICRAQWKTDIENRLTDMGKAEERVRCME